MNSIQQSKTMAIFPLIVYYMSETKTHKEKNKKESFRS